VRRIVTWALSTVAVLVLLFGYKTSTSGPAPAAAISPGAPAPGSGAVGSASGAGPGSGAGGATGSAAGRTYTGAVASTRWGDVQVAVTVADGKITGVQVPEYPDGNRRDEEINAQALPTLTAETLAAQSAKIDMVSGATVTSDGYLRSLQSALDQAGLG
jgi:uncharacterized protein with FMN-binding domain